MLEARAGQGQRWVGAGRQHEVALLRQEREQAAEESLDVGRGCQVIVVDDEHDVVIQVE